MGYYDATIDPSLRYGNLNLYHDSERNLVLRLAEEITAAQDTLGNEGSGKLQNRTSLKLVVLRLPLNLHPQFLPVPMASKLVLIRLSPAPSPTII